MRPRLSLALPALLLAACAGQPVAPPSPVETAAPSQEREQLALAVADLSTKAEALLRAQDELVWKHWTEGVPADLAKTYVGTEAWLTPEAVGRVARLRDITTEPRSGLMFTEALDRMMVGFREPLAYRHHHEWREILVSLGFKVRMVRVPDVLPYPHVVIAATRER